ALAGARGLGADDPGANDTTRQHSLFLEEVDRDPSRAREARVEREKNRAAHSDFASPRSCARKAWPIRLCSSAVSCSSTAAAALRSASTWLAVGFPNVNIRSAAGGPHT